MNLKKLPIRRIMLLLAIFAITFSGFVTFVPLKSGIESSLMYYVLKTKEISNNNLDGTNLNINFGSQKDGVLATCYFFREEVVINKKSWNKLDYRGRILLMAHEIAHCQKKIGHINKVDEWGCADNFMHYKDTGIWCNYYNFKKYVKQMKEI
jgi:hypothetical protein